MPAKRRRSKRRPGEDLADWECMFEVGVDYFGGLNLTEAEAREQAPAAWRRHGVRFLAERHDPSGKIVPWALQEFGPP